MNLLAEKQAKFDAFADKSVAAQKSLEIDDKTFGNIIEGEIKRIKEKYKNADEKPAWVEKAETVDTIVESLKVNSSEEYDSEIKMSYEELVDYLLNKYGVAKEDYF